MLAHVPQRIELADGSRVLIDATAMAAQGDEVLVLGSNVHAFGDADAELTGTIGVLRRARGQVDIVLSPLPTQDVRDPQAIAAPEGGWHVIFATGARGTTWSPLVYGVAEIWYSHYDGTIWSQTERLTEVRDARLSPGMASNLVTTGRGLAFAFPFDRSRELGSTDAGNQGAVMLFKDDTAWVQDTLRTWAAPSSIQLDAPDGKLRAIIAQLYFADGRVHGPALFTAGYHYEWGTPSRVHDPAPQYVSTLIVPTGSHRAGAVAWNRATREIEEEVLEWTVIGGDGGLRRSPVAQVLPGDVPALVSLNEHVTILLVRDGESREGFRVYAASDTAVRDIGGVAAPLMNFRMSAAAISDGRIIALTGGADTAVHSGPAFASFFTEITVQCAVGGGEAAVPRYF